ncbi:acyl-CoA dehydrogenase family protein [Pseudonocardia sp. N23]|uniref:acyl-CoA dehydrogenase family protein n=1 Tax=Pseudonocardia sp. N23 TaxID=1987376 RepID=UPI000BFE6C13|nr:acyl-CoA dehydrogenase family protein [Pseudonocardia sp. N23]GAY09819.1 acyl-CoA dehydrogenase family protein [Pseudonocardia sp. N23]
MPTVEELFAPPPEVAAHPAVAAMTRLCDDMIGPHAPAADDPARGVDPAHPRALAAAGLLSVRVPATEGGLGASQRVDVETVELLAGTCGATWFVVTQHRNPQGDSTSPIKGLHADAYRHGPAAARHRPGLAAATTLTGIAVAHIRRPGPPAVRAEPAPGGGWRFTGTADWCTGWGITDLTMIAATTTTGRFVFALVPTAPRPGLRVGTPAPLAVMGGTRTVGLQLDGMTVDAEEVLLDVDAAAWIAADAVRTADTRPATLGLLRRVLVELERLGLRRDRPDTVDTASVLGERAAALRDEAHALLIDVPAGQRVPERIRLRGEIAELTVRSANALVAARSGSATLLTSPEQRWVREAMFHLVQGQTDVIRRAQLAAFAG